MRVAYMTTVLAVSLLASAGCGSKSSGSSGSKYPSDPISIIVPYAAGGGVDKTARALAPILQRELNVTVNVVDVSGAGGVSGTSQAARAKADGYTLFFFSPGIVDAPWTVKGVTFGPQSFAYIGQITFIPLYLVVPTSSPFKTLAQLVDYGHQHPGMLKVPLIAGWPSSGIMGAEFAHLANLKMKTVSGFSGGPDMLVSSLAGRTSFSLNNTGEIQSYVQAGKIRILATSAPTRSTVFPDALTFKEQGYDVEVGVWQGLAAPAGTPKPILDTLSEALAKAAKAPELAAAFKDIGITVDYLSPADATQRINAQYETDGKLFKSLGISVK